jgi:hypothetical protein
MHPSHLGRLGTRVEVLLMSNEQHLARCRSTLLARPPSPSYAASLSLVDAVGAPMRAFSALR